MHKTTLEVVCRYMWLGGGELGDQRSGIKVRGQGHIQLVMWGRKKRKKRKRRLPNVTCNVPDKS